MANYFVGDIQGCFEELQLLLNKVAFNPSTDILWSVGDLVARGEGSLPTLKYLKKLDGSARISLGNHDLHLLAVAANLKRANPKDHLTELLEASELSQLIGWLRIQPLFQELPEHQIIMSHAGIPPNWDLNQLRTEATLVNQALSAPDYISSLISQMYTNSSNHWDESASELERQIYCINALTRMRYLYPDNSLDFDCKLAPKDCDNEELTPWFKVENKIARQHNLVFGHWAAIMGEVNTPNMHALDTGCCWGEHMTLWHLESDQKITQNKLKKS